MANPVVHFEIMGGQGKETEEFYSELFDWNIDSNNPLNYGRVDTKSTEGIRGGVGDGENGTRTTVYVQVSDINETLEKVKKLGGEIAMERTEIPNTVTLAMFKDLSGNLIGLIEDGSM